MKHSLKYKILIPALLSAISLMVVLTCVVYQDFTKNTLDMAKQNLMSKISAARYSLEINGNESVRQRLALGMGADRFMNWSFIINEEDLKILASNERKHIGQMFSDFHFDDQESDLLNFIQKHKSDQCFSNSKRLVCTGLFYMNSEISPTLLRTPSRIILGMDLQQLRKAAFESFLKELLFILMAAVVLVLLLQTVVNLVLLKPLSKMLPVISSWSSGDRKIRLPEDQQDELGQMSKELNRMIESLNSAEVTVIEQAKKMTHGAQLAVLGEMAGGVAHEINNPLAIIKAKLEQVKRIVQTQDFTEKERVLSEVAKIDSTTERISKIVKGLKTFSRNGENDPLQNYSLRQLMEDALSLTTEKFKNRGVVLRIEEVPDLVVNCRPVQISQVIVNLLNNSNDAVSLFDDKWIQVSFSIVDENLMIRFTDSGLGISEEIREKIMHPFFTTKEVGKGTGLGLSISKGIIENHGGQFYYDVQCKNTSFVFTLPMAKKSQQAA